MKNKYLLMICISVLCISYTLVSQTITHTVEKSETLYSLSRKYGVTVQEIQNANNMGSSNAISIGQRLVIPNQASNQSSSSASSTTSYNEYTVIAGDTLYSISRKNNLSVDELRNINNLSATSVLKIGQVLKVPSSQSITTAPTTPAPTVPSLPISAEDPREISNKRGDTSLVWPVKATEVNYVTGKISGVALTGAEGEQVKAIRSGTVLFSGMYRGFGQVVFVQDTTGHIYVYTGLSTLSVDKGDHVAYGTVLGNIGHDALSGKDRMNFMVYKNNKPLDPATAPRG